MDKAFEDISKKMIERYSRRYKDLGRDVKTLGWGDEEQQFYRFRQSFSNLTFSSEKSVLDIGCGFGDYLALLLSEKKAFKTYTGLDLNPDLVNESRKIWADVKNSDFEVYNIGEKKADKPIADIAVMFGVLNLNFKETYDNYEYSYKFIKNAFSHVNEVLVVDFLSSKTTDSYPEEDFVFYHDPAKMLEFALSLTPNVVLKHDYAPIPQKEFMLFLYK